MGTAYSGSLARARSSFAIASVYATWTLEKSDSTSIGNSSDKSPTEEFSQETGMTRYIARFMKGVLGENGHESEICQRSVEIEASNKEHAAELAKIKFCESENVKNWSLHADRVHIMESEFSS
jgi:hypothetical protein